MNTRALIIDDEPNNVENLQALLLRYCPQVVVEGVAFNAGHGRDLLRSKKPDLLFLDIQMPGSSGFDLLRSIDKPDFEIIFVTAFDGFAIQAMRFAAVDYLLKPVNISDLQVAVNRAVEQRKLKTQNRLLENLIHLLKDAPPKADQKIALSTLGETRFVKTSEIVRCESSNNYTTFYLLGGESLVVSKPIYEYEEILGEYGFVRCHQSHLVNSHYIKSWKKQAGDFLQLEDGKEVPISRGKKDAIKEILRL